MRKEIERSKWRGRSQLVVGMAFAALVLGESLAAAPLAQAQTARAQTSSTRQRTLVSTSPSPLSPSLPTVKGTGTPTAIPLWTSSTTIGNSVLSQSGTTVIAPGNITATSFTGDGSALSAVNAAKLGGSFPSAFAELAGTSPFTADQTINANLNLTGSINNALTLQGNVTDVNFESANVIAGFGGDGGRPPNSVAPGVVAATIAGGGGYNFVGNFSRSNTVTANFGTVGGGIGNTASGEAATVAGGGVNTAGGLGDTVAGGNSNAASMNYATVSGGQDNAASSNYATVSGGISNQASNTYATVSGGQNNTAIGAAATVPGGDNNAAKGSSSFAAGEFATASNQGSFVWSDGSRPTHDPGVTPFQFVARASGGFLFLTNSLDDTTGAALAAGSTSWSISSDRNVKANFASVDGPSLLEKLAALPILTWNYKTQDASIRHMGPVAQDFRAAFGLGEDDKHISTVDGDGVSLAAIQALYKLVVEKDKEIDQLRARLDRLEQGLKKQR